MNACSPSHPDGSPWSRQRPLVLWLTGLSGAGKTSLAEATRARLQGRGLVTCLLDGDVVRRGLCSDLAFSPEDRAENIRRAGEVARLMFEAGLIVIASFISPDRQQRDLLRQRFAPGEFHEVYVSTPLAVCEQRDPKGLYRRARAGDIAQFTGVSAPYDPPGHPELAIDTSGRSIEDCAQELVDHVAGLQAPR
jgi:adenylyl-sulfate kinase